MDQCFMSLWTSSAVAGAISCFPASWLCWIAINSESGTGNNLHRDFPTLPVRPAPVRAAAAWRMDRRRGMQKRWTNQPGIYFALPDCAGCHVSKGVACNIHEVRLHCRRWVFTSHLASQQIGCGWFHCLYFKYSCSPDFESGVHQLVAAALIETSFPPKAVDVSGGAVIDEQCNWGANNRGLGNFSSIIREYFLDLASRFLNKGANVFRAIT